MCVIFHIYCSQIKQSQKRCMCGKMSMYTNETVNYQGNQKCTKIDQNRNCTTQSVKVTYNDYLHRNLGTGCMLRYKTIHHKKTHNRIQRSRENWMQPEETDSEMVLGDKEESKKDWTLDECSIIEPKRLRPAVCVCVCVNAWAPQNRDTSQPKDQKPYP